MKNLAIKVALVTSALFVFDITTSFFYLDQVVYWVGLSASGCIIGYFFDQRAD